MSKYYIHISYIDIENINAFNDFNVSHGSHLGEDHMKSRAPSQGSLREDRACARAATGGRLSGLTWQSAWCQEPRWLKPRKVLIGPFSFSKVFKERF